MLAVLPPDCIAHHLRNHEFSRWIEDVFRDRPLGSHLHRIEERIGTENERDISADIAQAIRARYETVAESAEQTGETEV